MMSKFWIYGDSFARDWGIDWQWHRQLAGFANRDLVVKGDFGVSNDWILMQLAEDWFADQFKKDDVIILITTSCNRYWFLKDHPTISNYNQMTMFHNYKDKWGVTDEQQQAIELYFKHIHQGYLDAFRFDAHIAWINDMSNKLAQKGVKLMLLPGWDNFSHVVPQASLPVKGSLVASASELEFTSADAMDKWYSRPIPDQRVNHLIKDNHYELAKAIANTITTNTVLDLNSIKWKHGVLNVQTEKMFSNQLSPTLIR